VIGSWNFIRGEVINKKNIVLVFVLIFGFILALGCTESSEDSGAAVESETLHTGDTMSVEIPASAGITAHDATSQLSESKKEELIGYMTEHYGADEVSVLFISSSKPSSSGLLTVDYYTDSTPTQTTLNNNLENIIILSKSLAEESGIPNPDVSVCAMMMDGTPLGIGNYYSSTGETYIDVNACPWK
jgi:hypothetical protein